MDNTACDVYNCPRSDFSPFCTRLSAVFLSVWEQLCWSESERHIETQAAFRFTMYARSGRVLLEVSLSLRRLNEPLIPRRLGLPSAMNKKKRWKKFPFKPPSSAHSEIPVVIWTRIARHPVLCNNTAHDILSSEWEHFTFNNVPLDLERNRKYREYFLIFHTGITSLVFLRLKLFYIKLQFHLESFNADQSEVCFLPLGEDNTSFTACVWWSLDVWVR